MVKKASSRSKKAAQKQTFSSPVLAIFQWLSYAFWGWVGVATAALVGVSASYALNGYSGDYESVAYVVAAVLVLLPIALITDVLFAKQEKNEKTTAAMIIMVIHAVLFALIAVGALATVVFSLVSMVIGDSTGINGALVTLITAGTVFVFFGALTLRIMRPAVGSPLRLIVRSALTVAVVAAMIWGIAGPVTQTVLRRDDDQTVRALQNLQFLISSAVTQNGELPITSEQIFANPVYLSNEEIDAIQAAQADKRLTYSPNIRPAETATQDGEEITTFFYEICATFEYEDENRNERLGGYAMTDEAGFSETIPAASSDAGEQCFQLKQSTVPKAL